MKRGLILFAHGARDPRWAEPLVRLRDRVAARAATLPVRVAFLEHAHPDLVEATADLAALGVEAIRIVPVFFGRGGHLREDLPKLLDVVRGRFKQVAFEVIEPAGESDAVLDAIANLALHDLTWD